MPHHFSGKPPFEPAIQTLLLLSGVAALFFLMTNGIPLIQLGLMGELGKKSRYLRLMLISVSVFAVFMFLVRWKFPQVFDRSLWCVFWRKICRLPLWISTAGFFMVYAVVMTLVGFERHSALETRAFDLGIFAQAVWNTLQGDFFFSSIKENINLLGDHVSPILLVAAPFYAVWSDPRMLVLLQAVAAASSFFPLALIARDRLKDRSFTLVFLVMFFFFFPMRAALHEDFHPEVLAEPFLWWAFLFLEKKQVKWFVLSLLIAAMGKENFLGVTFMLGFYALLAKRMRAVGVFIMLGSIGLLILETKWLVPYLTHQKYFYAGNYNQVFADPVTHVLQKLANTDQLSYAFKIFLPFLFLPFFHLPTLILTFPVLFQNLLSANPTMRSFNYHYVTGLTPFLFISTIYAVAALSGRSDWFRKHASWVGFALLFAAMLRSGPSEYYFFWEIHGHRTPHVERVREKLRQVPQGAIVLTHNGFVAQLCNRKFVYQFDYAGGASKSEHAKRYKADYVVWDAAFWEPNTQSPEAALQDLKKTGFIVQFEQDGFCILKRGDRLRG